MRSLARNAIKLPSGLCRNRRIRRRDMSGTPTCPQNRIPPLGMPLQNSLPRYRGLVRIAYAAAGLLIATNSAECSLAPTESRPRLPGKVSSVPMVPPPQFCVSDRSHPSRPTEFSIPLSNLRLRSILTDEDRTIYQSQTIAGSLASRRRLGLRAILSVG